jgi:anti-sigma factor (TIGR02949 family)
MTTPDFEDCTDVLRHVYEFHDRELSEAEADEIRQHLMACEPCLDRYQVEDALRLLIRKCCIEQKAPEGLWMRVRATYSSVTITETTE